jgi:hypothetical protein
LAALQAALSRQVCSESANSLIYQWHANSHDSKAATVPDSVNMQQKNAANLAAYWRIRFSI